MLQTIIDRLNEQVPDFQGRVAGAAELAAALNGLVKCPVAFVLLADETSSRNELVTALSQRVEVRFGVVLVIRNVADARGKAAAVDLDVIRLQVMVALLNWQPSADHEPVQHVAGKLDNYDDQTLWWADTFTTTFYRRA